MACYVYRTYVNFNVSIFHVYLHDLIIDRKEIYKILNVKLFLRIV